MTQCDQIAAILEREGKIDNFRAIHDRISLRLGARIFDLKEKGWQIRTEELPDKNTVYHLISKPCTTTTGSAAPAPHTQPTSTEPPSGASATGSTLKTKDGGEPAQTSLFPIEPPSAAKPSRNGYLL